MKRIINRLLCLGVLLSLLCGSSLAAFTPPNGYTNLSVHNYTTNLGEKTSLPTVNLYLDGVPLQADLPAVIWKNTTMVPIRLVSESLGATVNWSPSAPRDAEIIWEDTTILLTQASNTAYVNGEARSLPGTVTPVLMKNTLVNSTMVPIRFVSEIMGLTVEWDPDTYSVYLISPEEEVEYSQVSAVTYLAGSQSIWIATESQADPILTDLGDRLVIDLPNFVLGSGVPTSTAITGSEAYSSIRCANHDDSLYSQYGATARIVLDLTGSTSYRNNLSVQTTAAGITITYTPSQGSGNETTDPVTPGVDDPGAYTVVIDPGHGGTSSGAVYEGIYEKDITLPVSLKVADLLIARGYNVLMTRWDDSSRTLTERSDFANAAKADVFVSIHANALSDFSFQGIMTFHHPNSIIGPQLAGYIQSAVLATTGGIDRGVRTENYAVLRQTTMPAALIEIGFMSNHEELMLMLDDSYQNRIAQGIAQGIENYFAAGNAQAARTDDTPNDSNLPLPTDDES